MPMVASFANLAFENYEIAAYTSLIALGEANGANGALSPLKLTLKEEQDMAKWVAGHLCGITLHLPGAACAASTAGFEKFYP